MEAEGSGTEPLDAREALDRFHELVEAGHAISFEEYCAGLPGIEGELRRLFENWRAVSRVLGGWHGANLSERLVRRFGAGSVRDLRLERESEPLPEAVFEELFRKLRIKREGFGRYRVKDEIGQGGMGIVLRVWDDELKRHLAMKLIRGSDRSSDDAAADSSSVGRFLDEAQITAQLEHPGIVPVHELGLDGQGRLYFTMRLVHGQALGEILGLAREEREGWNQTRVLGVLLRACEALAYAHSKGVIHRDLKPSNIMVGRFGEVYVMDWGLAKVVGQGDQALADLDPEDGEEIRSERRSATTTPGSPLITRGGHALGTPAYMAPEQARGDLAAMGPHSDVYSMGAILYQLLTGQSPYGLPGGELGARQVLARLLHGPPTPLHALVSEQPPELLAICDKAMARAPAERYPTTEELGDDLRAYLEHRVVAAHGTGSLQALKKWVERNRGLATSLAAAGALLIAWLFQYQRAEQWTVQAAEVTEANADLEDHLIPYSDYEELLTLARQSEDLFPLEPGKIPSQEEWLERARELRGRLDGHRTRLARLRERALPWSTEDRLYDLDTFPAREELQSMEVKRDLVRRIVAAVEAGEPSGDPAVEAILGKDPTQKPRVLGALRAELEAATAAAERLSRAATERRTWRYERTEDGRWDRLLTRLTEAIAGWDDGLLADTSAPGLGMPRRLALSRRMREALDAPLWAEAIESIADKRANPAYRGLRIRPQVGLQPLGPDPTSGFFEFAHLATGEPPSRDADGKLQVRPESALVLVLLPGGRTTLGAQSHEPGGPNYDSRAGPDEGPPCEIELAPFFLSKYEMTQGQWFRLCGEEPSSYSFRTAPGPYGSKLERITECHPVESVSWLDCESVLAWMGLELPTEAQWEYGTRGGTSTPFWGGDGLDALEGAANIADRFAMQETGFQTWIFEETFDDGWMLHCRVDEGWPNPFGLHGTLGNVSEWCMDALGAYDSSTRELDTGLYAWSQGGQERVYRGGSFTDPAVSARSSKRWKVFPTDKSQSRGLRPARRVEP